MISIVVPCYNCEKTFIRCIESLCCQTQSKMEIVLVDDGSVDRTYELCEITADKDSRIKVIHQENKGLMNAWKTGVSAATGEYIAFCDSDDWVEPDLIMTLEEEIARFHADIYLFGMRVEYEDKTVEYQDNQLEEGYYGKVDIIEKILPVFFSDGRMQSEIMLMSRWTKVFSRRLLMGNMKRLYDGISIGEDDLTTFVSVLSAESLYCMKGFYPYHYMRNNDSMIGKYDELMFQKFLHLKRQMDEIAELYQYPYKEQIEANFFSNALLCMKKEICRNKEKGYRALRGRLSLMREDESFIQTVRCCSVKKYELKSRIFAYLVIKRWYGGLVALTRIMDALGYGKD